MKVLRNDLKPQVQGSAANPNLEACLGGKSLISEQTLTIDYDEAFMDGDMVF